jgi:transcriptional antiterminator NusG
MEAPKPNSYWYVIRSISGQEKKVKGYIETEIRREKKEDLLYQILIPTEHVYEVKHGKKIKKERSYLPGYIFAEFSEKAITLMSPDDEKPARKKSVSESTALEKVLNSELIQLIRDIPGVVGFLGEEKGKRPIRLREDEVRQIMGKADELSKSDETILAPFLPGEPVKIIDGAFSGFEAQVEEVNEEKKKLKVLVKIFGRNQMIELGFAQVEREF